MAEGQGTEVRIGGPRWSIVFTQSHPGWGKWSGWPTRSFWQPWFPKPSLMLPWTRTLIPLNLTLALLTKPFIYLYLGQKRVQKQHIVLKFVSRKKKSELSFGNNTCLTLKNKEYWFIPVNNIITTNILKWLGCGCEEECINTELREIHSQWGFRRDSAAISDTNKATAALRSGMLFLLLHPPSFLHTNLAHISPHP